MQRIAIALVLLSLASTAESQTVTVDGGLSSRSHAWHTVLGAGYRLLPAPQQRRLTSQRFGGFGNVQVTIPRIFTGFYAGVSRHRQGRTLGQIGIAVQPVPEDWLVRPSFRVGAAVGGQVGRQIWDWDVLELIVGRRRTAPTFGFGVRAGQRLGWSLSVDWIRHDRAREKFTILHMGGYFRFR